MALRGCYRCDSLFNDFSVLYRLVRKGRGATDSMWGIWLKIEMKLEAREYIFQPFKSINSVGLISRFVSARWIFKKSFAYEAYLDLSGRSSANGSRGTGDCY
ncbi:hypothetical protein SPHINGO8BC_50507 [Sphingobacterium multivorum]|uniref:Uncharacterized protein n=1 Tax=Sphingobacterium multivorum TaxID=28454 RepID=A0A654BYZ0_SPHMU|nr:hypothetical protein SPHINGO8BC_50507 [Sphingobacterium multivorum]